MVDDAHGTGAVGPGGRGSVADAGLEDEVDVVVGTLGKAFGSYGAYALPPPAVAGALAALGMLREAPSLVDKLQRNARVMREALVAEGVPVPKESETQIIPIIVGDAAKTMAACERALGEGVFAQGIRPPTVPAGTSRLRLAVMASHTKSELRHAAGVLARAVRTAAPPRSVERPASRVYDGIAEAA
jgi:glycine C-acetyltransferase/8-amino-7-oxononanoate synthase